MNQSAPEVFETLETNDSALQRINAELAEQNRKLRELFEQRSASLSHLSHELRTPLTSILGFAEILLSQEQLTPAQRNFCERIQNSAHQLQHTLSQLSEVSRVELPPQDGTS
jgi:signal transduction histidine kinase